jgi:hypothetical protein
VTATASLLDTRAPTVGNADSLLRQRMKFAKDLYRNCTRWSQVLLDTFDKAKDRWINQGKAAAEEVLEKQKRDLKKLEYSSLRSNSEIVRFLREDNRLEPFANACASFYLGALDLKDGVYADIHDSLKEKVTRTDVEIASLVASWSESVDRMLKTVADEYHKVRIALG